MDLVYSKQEDKTAARNPPKNFEFEVRGGGNENLTKKFAHPWMGYVLLTLSVLGGSATGVVSNRVSAEGPFLKNAWRFQALLLVCVALIPFYFMYDRFYLRY